MSERFESEMTKFMGEVIKKLGNLEQRFDGLEQRFDGLEQRFDGLETEVKRNSKKLDVLSGQFNDVAVMAVNDNQRINKLETEFAELKSNIH
jgi:predicted  nucleic acid-binding Zn-ribbon protein